MSTYERQFSCSALNREGSTEMRMRAARVVFRTANANPDGRVDRAAIHRHGRDSLIDWIATNLAAGKTVILHPDVSGGGAFSTEQAELEES